MASSVEAEGTVAELLLKNPQIPHIILSSAVETVRLAEGARTIVTACNPA
jgi:nitrous oxidase accessory protein NosD